MYKNHRATLHLIAALALAIALFSGLSALSARADQSTTLYLPLVADSSVQPTPGLPTATPGPGGSLPAELVGTWFSGQLLNLQFYDRASGIWSDAGGLGHMYVFGANGDYTLVSYLKLGAGTTCESSVAKYHIGTARVVGASLLLTPSYARTRTSICGAGGPTESEGPYETTTIPWRVGADVSMHTKLWLDEVQGTTEYFKDGLAPQVIGAWYSGDGGAYELYDPASGQWAAPSGESSEWYTFYADGSYRHGRVEAGFGDDPCRDVTMSYDEGALSGSGGNLTLRSAAALRHVVSLCDPSLARDEQLAANNFERWTWALPEAEGGAILDLLRIEGGFRSIRLIRAE